MKFSENLIRLRKKENLSQEELGEKLNVARQTISKWENSETTPELDKLLEISKLFDISIDELVGNNIKIVKDNYRKNYYEFISKTKIGSLPLVHINIGYGLGNIRTAKGVLAIGNIAKGVFSFGGIAIGLFAFGGIAIGLFAIGGFALGIYAIGGCAIAKDIAAGGYANGYIAIGDYVDGTITFLTSEITSHTPSEIKNTILKEFPNIWRIIATIFSKVGL